MSIPVRVPGIDGGGIVGTVGAVPLKEFDPGADLHSERRSPLSGDILCSLLGKLAQLPLEEQLFVTEANAAAVP